MLAARDAGGVDAPCTCLCMDVPCCLSCTLPLPPAAPDGALAAMQALGVRDILAVDVCPEMLQALQQRVGCEPSTLGTEPGVRTWVGDVQDLPAYQVWCLGCALAAASMCTYARAAAPRPATPAAAMVRVNPGLELAGLPILSALHLLPQRCHSLAILHSASSPWPTAHFNSALDNTSLTPK